MSDDAGYKSFPPTIAKSILHRSLLKWWEGSRSGADCPHTARLLDEDLQTLFTDCMIYDVVAGHDGRQFVSCFQGPSVLRLFGRGVVGTALPDHVNPRILASVLKPYELALQTRRPVFTVRPTLDSAAVPMTIETLRLPLIGADGRVSKILAHYCIISKESSFVRVALQDSGTLSDNTVKAIIAPPP